MSSKPKPKRTWASSTSRPLFIRVAESMVIFAPMFHVGCFSASLTVTFSRSVRTRPRNGPPDAVRTELAMVAGSSPVKHICVDACSESTGTRRPPAASLRATRGPPATHDSLLASATRIPASREASVASQSGGTDHSVEDDFGGLIARQLDQASGPVQDLDTCFVSLKRSRSLAPSERPPKQPAADGTAATCSKILSTSEFAASAWTVNLPACDGRSHRGPGCRSNRSSRGS